MSSLSDDVVSSIPTWHGYPISGLVHPGRPWWTRTGFGWSRPDGAYANWPAGALEREAAGETVAEIMGPVLGQVDREHPLPCPPPRLGQVWILPPSGCMEAPLHAMVVNVREDNGMYWLSGDEGGREDWPPEDGRGVLVAGPFAPWAAP